MGNPITIYNNIDDYSPEELFALEQAGEQLCICEQGEERTLEQTRIMVAYKRLRQERNFRIVAEKVVKQPKEKMVKLKKYNKKEFIAILTKSTMQIELTEEEQVRLEYSKSFYGIA